MKLIAHRDLITVLVLSLLALASCKKDAQSDYTNLNSTSPSDLTLAFTLEMQGATHRGTMRIRGDKARTDIELPGVSLSTIQSESGDNLILNHSEKTWQQRHVEDVPLDEATDEELQKLQGGFPMRFSGRTQSIAGWECQEFLMIDITPERFSDEDIDEPLRAVVWIATEFPEGEEIQRHIERVAPNEQLKVMEKLAGKKLALPGFGLKFEVRMGSQSLVSTYTAIKQGELSDSIFEIPPDYLQSLTKQ